MGLKKSIYNVVVNNDECYLVYNTLIGSLSKCDENIYKYLKQDIITNKGYNIPQDKINKLVKNGFLVSENEDEFIMATYKKIKKYMEQRNSML